MDVGITPPSPQRSGNIVEKRRERLQEPWGETVSSEHDHDRAFVLRSSQQLPKTKPANIPAWMGRGRPTTTPGSWGRKSPFSLGVWLLVGSSGWPHTYECMVSMNGLCGLRGCDIELEGSGDQREAGSGD